MFNKLKNISPFVGTLFSYQRNYVASDLIAGLVVAIMLVPQAMAYAMLAGLPPQVGLYASIVPLILYSLFGTSNTLSVGPVAMVSLLVVAGISEMAEPGSPEFLSLCLTLALLVGLFQILMSALRMGFLVNFISHPVLKGFTSAAAIVIGVSQLKHLFGVSVERNEYPVQMIVATFSEAMHANPATLLIGTSCILLLFAFRHLAQPILARMGITESIAATISKIGPLAVVVLAASFVAARNLHTHQSVSIVGEIPAGLPGWTIPNFQLESIRALIPLALVITLVGFLESISVAKELASRRREKVSANRELFALGVADVGAAFTGGYPVTGGFSRSLVNYTTGARTPVASLVSAGLVAISLTWLTPLFFHIPHAALAAIIIVAVIGLIDLKTPLQLWRYSRPDAIASLVTFIAVLAMGIETGILMGVVSTIAMLMWNMSRPHIAEVGRLGNSEHFRNIERHNANQLDGTFAFRIDESLNFANAPFLESYLQEQLADRKDIQQVLLVASGINDIDATGIEILETIVRELKSAKVEFFMSDVKGPVMDRLIASGFDKSFLEGHVFLSAHSALEALGA